MPEQPGAGRLDADTLAAYVDGLLPPEERAKVEAEIATDPESYEWLVNSINAVDDDSIEGAGDEPVRRSSSASGPTSMPAPASMPVLEPVPGPERRPSGGSGIPAKVLPFYRRRAVIGGVGALVAAAASLLLVVQLQPEWWQRWRGPQVDPRFAKLVEAVGDERYIGARLTGGFKYGPLRQVMRGPGDLSSQNLQLLVVAGELQKAAESYPSAENLHAWGVAQLLLGDPALSITTLARAQEKDPSGAISTDLAAAYLTEAQRTAGGAEPGGLATTRELVARAIDLLANALSPATPERAFNYALALELAGDARAARQAWALVLDRDDTTEWRGEAEAHLRRLGHVNK